MQSRTIRRPSSRLYVKRFLSAAVSTFGLAGVALGTPLDPTSFVSLGTLNVTSGSITINTDSLTITGGATFNGGTVSQGGGNPQIAVFTFTNFNTDPGVTMSVTGSRPLALLSQGSMTIGEAINLNGGNGATDGTAGLAGAAGGSIGGTAGPGSAGGGPGGGAAAASNSHGGGGAHGGRGGSGFLGAAGGASYGDLLSVLQGGSGGSGANGASSIGGGGGGGGAIELGAVGAMSLASQLNTNGGRGGSNARGGGGGAGGGVRLHASTYALVPVTATGASGGGPGGGGGGGRIALTGGTLVGSQVTALLGSVNGGSSTVGGLGTAGVLIFRPDLLTVQSAQTIDVGITTGQTGRTDPYVETLPGSLAVESGGMVTLVSPLTWNSGAAVNLTGGQLNVNNSTTFSAGASLNVPTGSLVLAASQELSFDGGVGTITPNSTFSGGTVSIRSSGSLNLGGDATFASGSYMYLATGDLNLASGKTLNFDAGRGQVAAPGKGLSDGATMKITNGGSFLSSSVWDIGNGGVGTMIVDGANSGIFAGTSSTQWGRLAGNSATVTFSNSGAGSFEGGLTIAGNGGTALVNLLSNSTLSTSSLTVGSLSVGGSAAININGGTLYSHGTMAFRSGAVVNFTAGTFKSDGTMTVNGTAQVLLAPGGDKVIQSGRLIMTGTAKIDLADNDMIMEGPPVVTIRNFLVTGRNGGDWLGNGLTSSSAAADPLHRALGYALASDLFGGSGTFDGIAVSPVAVLVKYTYLGDSNLDGQVNIQDLLALATHYNQPANQVWTGGDFNYDGAVNGADLGMLAANWQAGVGAPLGEPLDATLANLSAFASVPEPALFGLVPGALLLGPRRRRKSPLN